MRLAKALSWNRDSARIGADMWIDTHCHLNLPEYEKDLPEVRARAEEAGVEAVVVVGIDLETSRRALALAEEDPWFAAVVGVHPHDGKAVDDGILAELAEMALRAVAIGETGLDYYRMNSPREDQKRAFLAQGDLALQMGKPMVIHSRDAQDEILRVLQGFGRELRGVMHCFSGDAAYARRCLDLGLHISIAGPVTYPKAESLRSVVAEIPLDRLLVETDCPFLAPQSVRGKRNEPGYVRFTGEMVAHVKGMDVRTLARTTTRNARDLFGIPRRSRSCPDTS